MQCVAKFRTELWCERLTYWKTTPVSLIITKSIKIIEITLTFQPTAVRGEKPVNAVK